MAELKTKLTEVSVDDFLDDLADPAQREDSKAIIQIMHAATKDKPRMWGKSIIGFGHSRLRYSSGKEIDWMQIAFSPRKQNIVLYGMGDFEGSDPLFARLGKHSRGKGCLYIKRLSDIHLPTLKALVRASLKHRMKAGSGDHC